LYCHASVAAGSCCTASHSWLKHVWQSKMLGYSRRLHRQWMQTYASCIETLFEWWVPRYEQQALLGVQLDVEDQQILRQWLAKADDLISFMMHCIHRSALPARMSLYSNEINIHQIHIKSCFIHKTHRIHKQNRCHRWFLSPELSFYQLGFW